MSHFKTYMTAASALTAALFVSATAMADTARYEAYDRNDDAYLDIIEYRDYTYDAIDADKDGMISRAELAASKYYSTESQTDFDELFAEFDSDENGFINRNEYANDFDSDIYDLWDTDSDGYIDTTEYVEMVSAYKKDK